MEPVRLDDEVVQSLIVCLDECSDLCEEIQATLRQERDSLVAFRMDELLENNARKEALLSRLHSRQTWLRAETTRLSGSRSLDTLDGRVPPDLEPKWRSARSRWDERWSKTLERSRSNQAFIQHSLRNLTAIADHLRSALGVGRLYSSKGAPVELTAEGSVVKAEL